ncbi:26_t:CDS:2 [Rhizophagus irregularis]|nr:26_t:CDS:2 [Rhizophagus irregularis]
MVDHEVADINQMIEELNTTTNHYTTYALKDDYFLKGSHCITNRFVQNISYITNNLGEFENDNVPKREIDLNPISPEIGMIFDNYDLAEHFLDQYAKSNGFVIVKG